MPRVSKRKKIENTQPQCRYYRTYLYLRLSEKDGGHGRKDSIYIQKQICIDHAKKHPELLVMKTFMDNGVTGTTFDRPEFGSLMQDVRAGKVDCIIVKDFSRFGRDALEAVDLIDVIFPTLDVRFISVLDEYDSENPACIGDRVNNILKHFCNDYYARDVSGKLIQAHKISRGKGEFWGARPPYGYKRSEESSKILIPNKEEKEIVQKIFSWFVFDGLSTFEIARKLNDLNVLSPADNMEMQKKGKLKKDKRILWASTTISTILQNPVYIGSAVYGKTKQMLCQNIPYKMIPRDEWEIQENVREPLVEKAIFEMSIQIAKERWEKYGEIWSTKRVYSEIEYSDVFKGKLYCENCNKKLKRLWSTNKNIFVYLCENTRISNHICTLNYVNENCVVEAVKVAMQYQIRLSVNFKKVYGEDFLKELDAETKQIVDSAKNKYESYEEKLQILFEHYATGILEREEYCHIKKEYSEERDKAHQQLETVQNRRQRLLDSFRLRMDWAEELLKYQNVEEINKGMMERFIERVSIKNSNEIIVCFWFGDIFEKEIDCMKGGDKYAV